MKLSEDNLHEILQLTKENPVFGYEIVETLSKDLLRLTVLCKDLVSARDDELQPLTNLRCLEALDVFISRIRHAVRNKENADV
tara:strand:+ start:574 stop:822 length:249 start_codon:yes stop_codon:yes gene_type:complete